MKVIDAIVGFFACCMFWVVNVLFALIPNNKAYDFGSAFARALFPLFGKRRRLAVDNIMQAGITADKAEAERIARMSWGHFVGHICEALKVPNVITAENWREHLDVSGGAPEAVKLLLEDTDEPILLVSGHHGVWEAATNLISFARPMIAIARTMNNKYAADWMKKHHFRGPVTVIDKNRGFTPEVMHQWNTEKAAMTILMDQHAGHKHSVHIKFFDRPAWTFTTATRLASRYGYKIVVGTFVRIAPFKYRLVGGKPVSFEKDCDKAAATQLLNDRLADAIRQYPEQYLWMHKRWRD